MIITIYMKDNFVALKLLVCCFCCFVDFSFYLENFVRLRGLGSIHADKYKTTPTMVKKLLENNVLI